MRCLIVDDDPLARLLLEQFVAQNPDLTLVGSCESAVEAAAVVRRGGVDLLFLDIEMPVMTGLEFVRTLSPRPQVVLVTAREEYAVEAFDVEAVDYLVKPVQYARFLQAVGRAHRQSLLNGHSAEDEHVFVRLEGRLVKLDLAEVQWIEAQGDYAVIRTPGKRLVVHTTMKALEEKLPPALFLRVHRSYIVRLDRIDGIEDASIVIGRDVVPIGSSYREGLLQRLRTL